MIAKLTKVDDPSRAAKWKHLETQLYPPVEAAKPKPTPATKPEKKEKDSTDSVAKTKQRATQTRQFFKKIWEYITRPFYRFWEITKIVFIVVGSVLGAVLLWYLLIKKYKVHKLIPAHILAFKNAKKGKSLAQAGDPL